MKVKLAKLSLCACGFPVLDESIHLGTEYEIDPADVRQATMKCGGCGKLIPLECVWVEAHGPAAAGFMPKAIFSL